LNRLKARHFKKRIIVGIVAGRNQMRTTLIILAGKTNLRKTQGRSWPGWIWKYILKRTVCQKVGCTILIRERHR